MAFCISQRTQSLLCVCLPTITKNVVASLIYLDKTDLIADAFVLSIETSAEQSLIEKSNCLLLSHANNKFL